MGMIRMKIWEVTSTMSQMVEAPDDVQIGRLTVILVERMSLPLNSPDGQIMTYKLHHKRTGQQLLDRQTLAEAGVINGDELRLQPEITAGSGRGRHSCLPIGPRIFSAGGANIPVCPISSRDTLVSSASLNVSPTDELPFHTPLRP